MQLSAEVKPLFGVFVVSFLFILGTAVTRPLRPIYFVEVGTKPFQLGLIMALPSLVALLTRVPISTFSNKLGKWRLMLLSLTLSAATLALFAFIYDPIWFFPIVSLAALSWSVFSPIVIEIISNQATPSTRGATMGLYFTSIGAALFIGPLLSSFFTLFMELRQLFLVSTIFPTLSLVVFLMMFRQNEMKNSQNVITEGDGRTRVGVWDSLARVFRIKNVIALCCARIAFSLSMGVFITIFPIYTESQLGFTASLISLLFSIRGITNLIIRMPAGRISDNIGRKKPFLLAYGIIIIVFSILPTVKNFTLISIVMALYGIGWGMRVAPSTALLIESVTSEDRTLALSVYMTMFDIGSTIGALLAGFTVSILSGGTPMLICVPIMLTALIVFLHLSREAVPHALSVGEL